MQDKSGVTKARWEETWVSLFEFGFLRVMERQ
jgi:hypothetical protein